MSQGKKAEKPDKNGEGEPEGGHKDSEKPRENGEKKDKAK